MTITFDSWRWFSDFINQRFLNQKGVYLGMVAVLLIPEIALRRIGPVGLGRLLARVKAGRDKGGPGHENDAG